MIEKGRGEGSITKQIRFSEKSISIPFPLISLPEKRDFHFAVYLQFYCRDLGGGGGLGLGLDAPLTFQNSEQIQRRLSSGERGKQFVSVIIVFM